MLGESYRTPHATTIHVGAGVLCGHGPAQGPVAGHHRQLQAEGCFETFDQLVPSSHCEMPVSSASEKAMGEGEDRLLQPC